MALIGSAKRAHQAQGRRGGYTALYGMRYDPMRIYTSLSDSDGSQPVENAVAWLEGTLLHTVAITVAIIAVATVGLLMLTGRLDIRRGVAVVVGCFILFGAPAIVAGLQSNMSDRQAPITFEAAVPSTLSPPPVIKQRPAYDPYAGASVPMR